MSYRIVVGMNGSENSSRALQWAVEEAKLRGAAVTALLAWELPLIGVPGAFDQEELQREAMALLNQQVAQVGADGVVEAVVARGDPGASLVEACRHYNADMLVLGSRGTEGFGGRLLGSVGQECTAYAPCPVVIAREKEPAAS